ncbi:MAG: hypothetical protein GXP28_11590 [Planctomycetes bacterium]|nr:hypothetical protein [Planctomycetota bacterium]
MIPDFRENGYLPPGLHPATLDEVLERFRGQSEIRDVQMESVRWAVDLAKQAGVDRFVINGSFVTAEIEPNDVDCVLLITDSFPLDAQAEAELLDGLPFLEIQLVDQIGFDLLVNTIFATDRIGKSKGMIEVLP